MRLIDIEPFEKNGDAEIHWDCDDKHGYLPTDKIPTVNVETISDGYHTFADLYEQRLILSAALAKNNPFAWKSRYHEDGTEPFGGGWFIVGFDTEEGSYTYHYELKDWDLFKCQELPVGKHWDGHTSKEVYRLLSLPTVDAVPIRHGKWLLHSAYKPCDSHQCSVCGIILSEWAVDMEGLCYYRKFCPRCGARMDGAE